MPPLLVSLLHACTLLAVARVMNPLHWPMPLLAAVSMLYVALGMMLAAWQWQPWVKLPRRIVLLHQPRSPWTCVLPLLVASALLLVLAIALPIALTLMVIAAFGHTVAPVHAGYALLAWLIGLTGYFGGVAAMLGGAWGRWLVLALPPLLWLSLGDRPLPQLLATGIIATALLATLAFGRIHPIHAQPPASRARRALEALLLLVPASWLLNVALQGIGQGLMLATNRHPSVESTYVSHFEHWRASKPHQMLEDLWPTVAPEPWRIKPADPPLLRHLYPGHPLPRRLSPGSESVAQMRIPKSTLRAEYHPQLRLFRLVDERRRTKAWLGHGCPASAPEDATPLGGALPIPADGGLIMVGSALLDWQGDCLHRVLQQPEGALLLNAAKERDGWTAMSREGLHHVQQGQTSWHAWAWPRPLIAVQTLLLWRHPSETRWLLLLLEGHFLQPSDPRLSLWMLLPGQEPMLINERRASPDFPNWMLWSDTWPMPLQGLLKALAETPRPPAPPSVLVLMVATSLLSAVFAGWLTKRRTPGGAWLKRSLPWMLAALATGPPMLAVQQWLQPRQRPR